MTDKIRQRHGSRVANAIAIQSEDPERHGSPQTSDVAGADSQALAEGLHAQIADAWYKVSGWFVVRGWFCRY